MPAPIQAARSEGTEQVLLGGSTEIIPVKFTLTPADVGRRTYRLEVKPPAEDRNTADNCAGGRRRDRRSQDQGLAAGQRADARIHFPSQPIAAATRK